MSVIPIFVVTRQRTKEHTWHLWCRDSGLTWLKQTPRGRGQAQQEPTQWHSRSRSRTGRKPSAGEGPLCWKPGQWKTNSAESSRGPVSDSRRPPVKVGGPCSYGLRDIPNEILIPLQSLIPCFLKPPANRRVAGGTTEGLWRGYSSSCPKGAICWAPVAVTQVGGGFLSFLFSVPRIRPMKLWAPVRYLANFPAGYEGDSLACFPTAFSSCPSALSMSFCNAWKWKVKVMSLSEVVSNS